MEHQLQHTGRQKAAGSGISFSNQNNLLRKLVKLTLNYLLSSDDSWEIPFEEIRDLKWLGSGAQGAVFMGTYQQEILAVKKVKEEYETDIKHLRKLNHPNIVQFK